VSGVATKALRSVVALCPRRPGRSREPRVSLITHEADRSVGAVTARLARRANVPARTCCSRPAVATRVSRQSHLTVRSLPSRQSAESSRPSVSGCPRLPLRSLESRTAVGARPSLWARLATLTLLTDHARLTGRAHQTRGAHGALDARRSRQAGVTGWALDSTTSHRARVARGSGEPDGAGLAEAARRTRGAGVSGLARRAVHAPRARRAD